VPSGSVVTYSSSHLSYSSRGTAGIGRTWPRQRRW
jgi:hypothetical protein